MLKKIMHLDIATFIAFLAGKKIPILDQGQIHFKTFGEEQKPSIEHYKQFILPNIHKYEEQRINLLKIFRIRCFLFIPILITILTLSTLWYYLMDAYGITTEIKNYTMGTGLLLGVAVLWVYAPVSKYKLAIKSEIFPLIFSFFRGSLIYQVKSDFPLKSVLSSGIIPLYDYKFMEDSIKGTYKDVKLHLTQATLEIANKAGKNNTRKTIFKGIIIQLSMNRSFYGKTIVRKDAGVIGNLFGKQFETLQNVKLEDPVFEKQFEVYASDQIEARYLLNPSFMERLIQLAKLFNNEPIQCSFFENSLLITISSSKDYFEPGSIFAPATFEEDINTVLEQMHLIFQIIDILKLNEKNRL
ncbi:DUF3137 domain-containing protein [Candidatus Jidaibacter acanthamoebae]|nr:DUF3137 domain-containing protein [Candidatus Jidaibacter acanthamoeba]